MASPLVNTWAKGRFIEKCMLPLGTDSILVVPIQSTSIPSDATLQDCANLGAVFTAGALEATFTSYTRPALSSSSITITTNTTANTQAASFTTQVWNAAGGALNNTLAAIVLAYRPTSGTADSGCLVLATISYAGTTTGGNLTAVLGTLTDT
jgi:hypothetical protein